MQNSSCFIDNDYLAQLLDKERKPDNKLIGDILAKGADKKGLTVEEAAILTQIEDPEQINLLYETANKIKTDIYGNRIVIFAPLYISNECANICDYCGFRADNQELLRRTLTLDEIQQETVILEKIGYKRLLLVYGEHPRFDGKWIADTVEAVYRGSKTNHQIRRININSAPLSVEDFKIIKNTGIGTYQCFQETYHRKTYENVHLKGKKADYDNRLSVHDKAFAAGIDDVGMGVLFGLYDWKFEILGLLSHSLYLEKTYGVGPHTISFPRIEPALNAPLSEHPPHAVTDNDLKKIVAILRISVPYTGIILTTRETMPLRNDLLKLGVSQISAGSRTYPGGYYDELHNQPSKQQFTIGDTRSLDEVIKDLARQGFIPSFCTSCYRKGRTGQTFMEFAKPGNIHKFCQPNALLTFLEYLLDSASLETKETGLALIEKEISSLPDVCLREFIRNQYSRILQGKRDIIL
jgi:2-iminoacetate synthase